MSQLSQLESLNKILEKEDEEIKEAQDLFNEKAYLWEQIEIPIQLLKIVDLMGQHSSITFRGMNGQYKTDISLAQAIEKLVVLRKQVVKIWEQR